ncbi:PAS domain-containing sensor histidine kinase [Clostridia bacterium]|nr:PAS domain-containing sensor histidine kinase [Clostridia bacterium]
MQKISPPNFHFLTIICYNNHMQKPFLKRKQKETKPENPLNNPGYLIAITNNISGAVLVLNKEEKIVHYNAASLDLLNTNTNLLEKGITTILKLKTKEGEPFPLKEKIATSKVSETYEDLRLGEKDEEIRLELTLSPIKSNVFTVKGNETIGYVIFFRDITKTKSLEEERNEFISVVSHELRTPSAVIEGTISNLEILSDRPELDKTILKKTLETAHNQAKTLEKIINDLSTLSRAERNLDAAAEPVDIKALLNQKFLEHTPIAEKAGLRLNLNVHLKSNKLITNPFYIEEILQNLLGNAEKYTDKGEITLKAEETEKNIEISVIDTGIGIAKADREKIFEKFYRAEDFHTRKSEGIGLGLYIVKKLAKKLEAEITLESRPGFGSTFTLKLPKHQSQ